MAGMMQFTPNTTSYQLVMTASSVSQTFNAAGIACEGLYVYNGSTVPIALRFGIGAQTAVTTDFTMAPGAWFVLGKGFSDTIAAIGASGTLYVTPGRGQ